MANTFVDYGDDDIIAHYENQKSDSEHSNLDEAEEATSDKDNEAGIARKINPAIPKTHVVRNPVPKLNTERLKGPNGIQTIEKYFEGFKFYGKGHEKADLNRIMKRLEHWSYRLFPKYYFDDFLMRIEQLGNKKDLQVFIKKYRLDMLTTDDAIIHNDTDDEDKQESVPLDNFDLLIAEQIEKQKQTEAQTSTLAVVPSTSNDVFNELLMQFDDTQNSQIERSNIDKDGLSNEVKEKIERNKQLAIQRRLQRQKEREDEQVKKSKSFKSTNIETISEENHPIIDDGTNISDR